MYLKNKIKKILLAAVPVAAMLCSPVYAGAANVKAEVMTGHKAASLDMKVSGEVAPKTSIYVRNTTAVDYTNNATQFTLAQLSYNLVDKLGLDAGAQLAGKGIAPYAGLEYFLKADDFSAMMVALVTITDKPTGTFLANMVYAPKLTENVNLFTRLENTNIVGKEGHLVSTEKLRLGLDIKGYILGTAANLTFAGNKPDFSYNIGGFVAKEF